MTVHQSRLRAAPRADALTGLRFVAAAAIVFWHSQADYLFGQDAFQPFALLGAVALFFILSGYVLAVNAWKYTSWPSFWVARIARIWPAHAAAVLLWLTLFYPYSVTLMLSPEGSHNLALNLSLLQSWSPDMSVFWSYNAPSWSVSVELFFYAMFPVCLALLQWRPVVGLAGIFLAAAAFLFGMGALAPALTPLWLGYINPVVNLPLFALGIVAGLLHVRMPPPQMRFRIASLLQSGAVILTIGGNAAMAIPIHSVTAAGSMWLSTSGACWCYVALIFTLGRYDGIVSQALATPVLVYLGEVSYGLYLVHQLFFRWHAIHYQEFHFNIWLQYSCLWIASIMTAIAVHHLVERPAQRLSKAIWRRLGVHRKHLESGD